MSRKQLLKKVESALENVAATSQAVPAVVLYQTDGSRVVIGSGGRRLPDDTPAAPTTKVLIGIDYDAI